MDKQHFDHIESRMRQAANEISVPASDEAWKKMEGMLDAEFRKDRRRGGIWLWLLGGLLILVVSAFFIYQHFSSKLVDDISAGSLEPQTIKSEKETDQEPKIDNNGKTKVESQFFNDEDSTDKTVAEGVNQQQTSELSLNKQKDLRINNRPSVKGPTLITTGIAKKRSNLNASARSQKPKKSKKKSSLALEQEIINPAVTNKISKDRTESVTAKGYGLPGNNTVKVANNTAVIIDSLKAPGSAISNTEKQDSVENNRLQQKNSPLRLADKRKRGFYVIASVAADLTAIRNILKQHVKPVYGLAVGYQFNKRLNVQAGFYAGKKIYSAGPYDYKIKPGSYVAKIIRADAECDIYEIPVSIRYNVLPRKAFNGYLMAGLSSVILKKETYDMHFYNASGTYRRMSYTYKDNTAFLSILNLAIGYEHKLSNALYIQAEPYLKFPLSGLGEGKVKLYSAGLQLGVKYQLFNSKRKRI